MPKISVFRNISEPSTPITYDLLQYLEDTRDGMWENIVKECRAIRDKDARNEFKKTMPTATLSGEFSYRNEQGLINHSEIIAMDLDHLPNPKVVKRQLEQDKYVYSVFISTSGDGLRVLFKIDPNKHRESFKGVANYLYENYNQISDPNGSNLSKPYVVSFDPLLFLNPNEVPVFKKYIKETVIKPLPDFVHTQSDFDDVLKQIIGRGVNICEDYNDWLKVGFAIADKFGEDGRQYFHQVSAQSLKYNEKKCDLQYNACLKDKGLSKVNISTFYYLAKINNVSIVSEQTRKIVRTTKNGKRSGLSKEKIVENLKKFENISGAEQIVTNIFDNVAGDTYEEEEESILHLLEIFISNNYSLKMNEVTGYLEHEGRPQSPSDLNTIFIAAKKVVPKLDYQLLIRLLKSDFIESFNPFFKFLGSDGIAVHLPATPVDNSSKFESPLIDLLASTIKNDNPSYTEYFTRKWIVSIISAMHKVHSPLLHCLLGAQNTGKTEFYRRLLPSNMKQYYSESKLDKGKDDELLMCENILIMDDELSGKSKSDTIKLNGVTSCEYFSLRRPYGDHNEKVLRYAVLCGTSNYPKGVLSDPTGNRRIIPVDVEDIDKELYNSIDKNDLFHEAFRLYKEGFDWRVTAKDIPYLNKDSEKYETIVKERELLLKYYQPGEESYMFTTEILVELELMTRQKISLNILGRELINLGFKKKSVRINSVQTTKKWGILKNRGDEVYKREDLPF